MNKAEKKLFCEISPLCYEISVFKCCMLRRLRDLFSKERFCRKGPEKLVPAPSPGISFFEYGALVKFFDERGCEIQLPVVIYKHKSLIRRQLGDVDMTLQNNKAVNLSLAAPKISGALIHPGETFSLWHLVGKTSSHKGYKEGLMIKRGKPDRGIGGGLCQLSNLIHWIILHTPLEITEHHHHDGVDLFPDFGRQVPFGVGTSISYNYLDYRFKNNTEQTFQLIVYTDEKYLNAELRAEKPLRVKYHIECRNEHFTQENGIWYRNGEVWRQCVDKASGKVIEEKLIKTNHAKVMYDEKYIIDSQKNVTMETPDFENLNGAQWAHLLCEHPEFADKCDWSKLNSEDWELLLSEQSQFAEHCVEWFYLLPRFAHICRWETFSGWKWAMLLVRCPELADKCDWKKLDDYDWHYLVYYQPQFKKNYYYKKSKVTEFIKEQWNGIWNSLWFMKHCIWLKIKPVILKKLIKMNATIDFDILTGREWADLLYDHPVLALVCDWENLRDFDWEWILSKNPWYANKYDWSKAHWWHFGWDDLFQKQPSFFMKLPWSQIKDGYAWALRIAAHPEFADECDWELLDGYAWQKLLSTRPEFAHLCPWEKLNGLAWHYLIINRPQFADKCDWDKLDQDNWTELLLKNPAYADKCDWKKIKYDHLLKKLLRKYPQFTDNFDYSELNASAMVKLCLVQPLVFKHCRLENFSGRDWVDLLKNRPMFAEYCPWEKLYAEDWCLLLAVQPRFAEHFDFRGFLPWHWADLLVRQPQFAELCPFRDKFYRDDWGKLIAGQPQFADRCDLSVLGRWDWVRILSSQPQFADKCPAWCWENFDGDRWSSLLINQPQFADRCDWQKLNGIDWKELLAVQPQFATHCNFSKLTPEHWQYLLWKQPHLADKCNWKKFKSRDWRELLASHPEYGKYCNWQKLTGEDWCWVLQSHPHFFKKCKWRKLNGSQWRFLLSHCPEFARFCNWKKLKPQDWQMLLEVRPEFAEKYQEYSSKDKFFCHFLQKIIPFNSRSKI